MKKLLRTTIVLLVFFSVASSFAQLAHANCLDDNWIPLASKVTKVGDCTVADPLLLVQTEHNYPLMTFNPYNVEIWQGTYVQKLETATNYLHEVLDRCDHGRIIYSGKVTETLSGSQEFEITNPNLSDDIAISYEILPMTEIEAQAAFTRVKAACETFIPDLAHNPVRSGAF
jgi:hypothetical protein